MELKTIETLNGMLSEKFGIAVKLEEVKNLGRMSERYLQYEAKPINENLGLFGRCFKDIEIIVDLYKQEAKENLLCGEARIRYKLHNGGSNGASAGLRIAIENEEIMIWDEVEFQKERHEVIMEYYPAIVRAKVAQLGMRLHQDVKEDFVYDTLSDLLKKHTFWQDYNKEIISYDLFETEAEKLILNFMAAKDKTEAFKVLESIWED